MAADKDTPTSPSVTAGYYDDVETHTFGWAKKTGEKIPQSDFNFKMVTKVVAKQAISTGYLAEVTAERVEDEQDRTRLCYFTSRSTMNTNEFMSMINYSFKEAGLTCNFNNIQMNQLYQLKKRKAGSIVHKFAVQQVGLQDDGKTWVLGPSTTVSSTGKFIPPTESKYIWIGDLYCGPSIAPNESSCRITLPLKPSAMIPLVQRLENIMGHNFYPTMMTLGACAMALHYEIIHEEYLCCPVPFIFGDPATGKTTALRCALSMIGLYPTRYFSKATKEKYASLCSTSTLPLVIDDPRSQSVMGDLIMSLYNGAFEGTIGRGNDKPSCMALIGANITASDKEMYISRCALIEFFRPHVDFTMAGLPDLMKQSSAAVGEILCLGENFKSKGMKEIDTTLKMFVREAIPEAHPRIVPIYAMLLWFTQQIIHAVSYLESGDKEDESDAESGDEEELEDHEEYSRLESGLFEHFRVKCSSTITRLQVDTDKNVHHAQVTGEDSIAVPNDGIGEELLSICEDLLIYKVWQFMRTNDVNLMVRIEDMPVNTPASLKTALRRASQGSIRCNLMTTLPGPGETPVKLTRHKNATQKRCVSIALRDFSNSIKDELIKVTTHPSMCLKNVPQTVNEGETSADKRKDVEVVTMEEGGRPNDPEGEEVTMEEGRPNNPEGEEVTMEEGGRPNDPEGEKVTVEEGGRPNDPEEEEGGRPHNPEEEEGGRPHNPEEEEGGRPHNPEEEEATNSSKRIKRMQKSGKRPLTRSQGEAKQFTKKICKGISLFE